MTELNANELLKRSKIEVSPETFNLVSLYWDNWRLLLNSPQFSPRMTAPFMIFMDGHEVTLMLDDADLVNIRPGLTEAKIERAYRLLTFDIVLDHSVVGFMAEIARILAEAEVSILPISAYSRDSILIKQNQLATALRALGPYVDEIC